MTDKDLKRLSRLELVDIIYELQKQNAEKDRQIDLLNARLDSQNAANKGLEPLLAAAEKLETVYAAAQNAADRFVESNALLSAEMEKQREVTNEKCEMLVSISKQKSVELISNAQRQAAKLISEAGGTANFEKSPLFAELRELVHRYDNNGK